MTLDKHGACVHIHTLRSTACQPGTKLNWYLVQGFVFFFLLLKIH